MHLDNRFSRFVKTQFAPPNYLTMPTVGIDISSSAIKIVSLVERIHGLELESFIEEKIPAGAVASGEVADKQTIAKILRELAKKHSISRANISLPETRGYLFETTVEGSTPEAQRMAIEQHLDEYVPLPPAEVIFDSTPLSIENGRAHMVGIGYAHRVIDELLFIFEEAGIEVRAIESETFALPRAIIPHSDTDTVLIIDIGKLTTKLEVVSKRFPRLATTLDIGGHALTLAVQKHFGVTEEDAKKVKAEKGLTQGASNDEYVAAMLSTVSAIRDEIVRRIDYWDSRKTSIAGYQPITRAIIVGGNATVRGLPEYLETALKMPVELGDVFTNLAPRTDWLPPLDYMESLAFGTAIGLALREYVP